MPAKNDDNTQFCRVATSDGESFLGAASTNDGVCALSDEHGRLLTVPVIGGITFTGILNKYDSGANVLWALAHNASIALFQAFGSQNTGIDLWVHMYDLAAGPPAGASDFSPILCPDGGNWSLGIPQGFITSNGLLVAYSLVQASYIAPPSGGWITVLYRNTP